MNVAYSDLSDLPARPEPLPQYGSILQQLSAGTPFLFLTGRAGTGKSSFIHHFAATYPGQVAVVAPTGIAALNARGQTIHSFFQFPPRIVDPASIVRVRRSNLLRRLEVLVIDEVSMVRADLMDAIDYSLRLNRDMPMVPFGGVRVIGVGDMYQLPPVVPPAEEEQLRNALYHSPYFFDAHIFAECPIHCIELTKIFRQRDPTFVGFLNAIREQVDIPETVAALNRACYRQVELDTALTLTCTNSAADTINDRSLQALPGIATIYEGTTTGKLPVQQDKLPSPIKLVLKVGSQVLFTKNDPTRRWVNGTLGIVRSLSATEIAVEVREGSTRKIHAVERVTWETYSYRYDESIRKIVPEIVGSYTQFPLMLAWAVTIHKSQGMTLDEVKIDLGRGAFAHGQTYVALSRCRSLERIMLAHPLRVSDIQCDSRIATFYQSVHRIDGSWS